MIIASAGIICTMRIAMMRPAPQRKRKRVTASAARNAKTSATATVIRLIVSEFTSAGANGARVSPSDHVRVVVERERSSGQKCSSDPRTCEFGWNEVLTIQ